MDFRKYTEEIEEAVQDIPIGSMRNRARKVIKHLLTHAQPGNLPFWRLVNEFGFEHDYQPEDAGEPPAGAHW